MATTAKIISSLRLPEIMVYFPIWNRRNNAKISNEKMSTIFLMNKNQQNLAFILSTMTCASLSLLSIVQPAICGVSKTFSA